MLDGKIALVTGGSRGIGRGVAERLAASGALVAVHYAGNAAAAEATVGAIRAKGGQAFAVQARFGEPGAIDALLTALDAELSRRTGAFALDVLVNNAGGGHHAPIAVETEASYDATFALNTRTPFFLAQALLPRLRPGGSIVNVSSSVVQLTISDFIAYGMAKAAIETFTRMLAKQAGPAGVRVNAVVPGFITTDATAAFLDDPRVRGEIEAHTALRRIGEPEDMAGAVHALVSPDMAFVTGQVIEVSGGLSAGYKL